MASEPARARLLWARSSPWFFPSRSDMPLHAVLQPWLSLQWLIICHEALFRLLLYRLAPFPLVLGCSQSSTTYTDRPWYRKFWDRPGTAPSTFPPYPPPTQPARPPSSPNYKHYYYEDGKWEHRGDYTRFVSLVSSMRATNPANKIRLPRMIASVLSLPVFIISVSR